MTGFLPLSRQILPGIAAQAASLAMHPCTGNALSIQNNRIFSLAEILHLDWRARLDWRELDAGEQKWQ
ncbi:MAG: hypothetical protein KF766_16025 [Rhodocyclaceae bacterium]|nr:hypothetical protein [Rhodocyclaceae bacterium]